MLKEANFAQFLLFQFKCTRNQQLYLEYKKSHMLPLYNISKIYFIRLIDSG